MKKPLLILFNLLVCLTLIANAQTRVTGKITSEDGDGLPGTTVTVKGTSTSVASDVNGVYTINAPGNATLVFSAVGFQKLELPVNGRTTINASLKTDQQQLEEVMVVAYGTANKATYTGSATVVKPVADLQSSSFESGLTGRVAGLQFTQNSGQAGSSVAIRIRGTGSMNASNEPLYVIDGVPANSGDVTQLSMVSFNVMASLNPSDIESITVLKDAAASTLYGSRAANGVILITTKKGKVGKTTANFKTNIGYSPSFAYNNWELASPEDQRILLTEMYYNAQIDKGDSPAAATLFAENKLKNDLPLDPRGFFDWEDALLRTGSFQTYDFNVQGGNENTKYYSSIGFTKDDGRVYTNNLDRVDGRLNISQKLVKNVELTSNLSFGRVKKDGFNDTNNNGANYFQNLRNQLYGEYWPTTVDGLPVTTRYKSFAYNSLYYDTQRENTAAMKKLTLNETLRWDIIPNLTAKTIFSYDLTDVDDHILRTALHHEGTSKGGYVREYSTTLEKLVSSTTLNYNKTFNGVHNFSLLAGVEGEKNTRNLLWGEGSGLSSDILNVISAGGTKTADGSNSGSNLLSALSRLEYNYNNRYYFGTSFRRDGSSKLSPNTRWGNFWSLSGAWRVDQESFFKVNWINNLKLKASYGINGTLPTDNYGYWDLYASGYNYNGKPGGQITNIGEENLAWEENHNTNIGLESSYLNGRINFNIEYFNRDSKNLLQDVPIPAAIGITRVLQNIGEMNNRGFEIELSGDVVKTKNLNWFLSVNTSKFKSKVKSLYGGADVVWYDPTGGDSQAKFVYREGFSPKSLYGKEWAGVDPANGKGMWYLNNPSALPADINNTINGRPATYKSAAAAEVIYGNTDPEWFGGFSSALSWKSLAMDMNFSYSLGGDMFNGFEKFVNDDGFFSNRTRTEKVMTRWQKPGDITDVPRRVYDTPQLTHQSRYMYENNYLRLKTISLSYNLPKSIISRAKMSNVRLFVSGANLLTFANQDYFDPEVNVYGVQSWDLPMSKTYSFGVDVKF